MAAGRARVLPLRGHHAGDAGRLDRAAAAGLSELGRGGAGLRVPGRVLSRSSPTPRSASPRSTTICSTCSSSIAPRAGGSCCWLRIPSALPYFLGGLRIGGGLALIGAIVAEIAAGSAGQGAGPRLPHRRIRLSAQHSAHVRGAVADLRGRHHDLPCAERLSYLLLHRWHDSARSRET